jgi:O-antigen/teichoic acid export membrane protein
MERAFLKLFSIRILGLALTFVTIIALKESQGIESVGIYYLYLNSIILSGSLATVGLSSLVQKRYASKLAKYEYLQVIVSDISSRLWLILTIAIVSVFMLFQKDSQLELLLVILVSLLYCFTCIFVEVIRFSISAKSSEILRNILRPGVFLLFFFLANSILVGLVASFIVEFLVCVSIAFKGFRLASAKIQKGLDWIEERENLNLFLINSVVILFSQIDIIMLSKVLSNEALGTFATVNRYAFLMSVGLYVGNIILVRNVNSLFKFKDNIYMSHYVSMLKKLRYYYLLYFAALLFGFEFYLHIFSISIGDSYEYFFIIATSFLLQAMMGSVNIFFVNLNMAWFLSTVNMFLLVGFCVFFVFFFDQISTMMLLLAIYSIPVVAKFIPYAYFEIKLRKRYGY